MGYRIYDDKSKSWGEWEQCGRVFRTSYNYWGDGDGSYTAHWLDENNEIQSQTYKHTYGLTGEAIIDATPEVYAVLAVKARPILAERNYERALSEAQEFRYGRTVQVVRGRKIPIGTTGVIKWMGESHYGYYPTKQLGISVCGSAKYQFTAQHNCEVVITDHPDIYDYEHEVAMLSDEDVVHAVWPVH